MRNTTNPPPRISMPVFICAHLRLKQLFCSIEIQDIVTRNCKARREKHIRLCSLTIRRLLTLYSTLIHMLKWARQASRDLRFYWQNQINGRK
jgi:hypothetical protein